MKSWTRWLYLVAALAAAVVGVSAAVQAVLAGSWGPVAEVGWLPAVVVAVWPGARRRCLPRRHGMTGRHGVTG